MTLFGFRVWIQSIMSFVHVTNTNDTCIIFFIIKLFLFWFIAIRRQYKFY